MISVCCRAGHLLAVSDNTEPWTCDGSTEEQGCLCGESSVNSVRNETRYRCDMCDFDYCGKCYSTRGVKKGPHCPAGHAVRLSHNRQPWICDGSKEPQGCVCGPGTAESVKDEPRYRCIQGCDFDYCGKCYLLRCSAVLSLGDTLRTELFSNKVESALTHVRNLFGREKIINFGSEVSHTYQNKFDMSTALIRSAIASTVTSLGLLGVTTAHWERLLSWHSGASSVTLRVKSIERCSYLRTDKRQVETDRVAAASFLGSWSSKSVTTLTEYVFLFSLEHEIIMVRDAGSTEDDFLEIRRRIGQCELRSDNQVLPCKEAVVLPHMDINLSWLLSCLQLESAGQRLYPQFVINQSLPDCHTPTRNCDVTGALKFFGAFQTWVSKVYEYFATTIFPKIDTEALNIGAINTDELFVPILPIFFVHGSAGMPLTVVDTGLATNLATEIVGSVDVSSAEAEALATEENRNLSKKIDQIQHIFSSCPDNSLITQNEAVLMVSLMHIYDAVQYLYYGLDYIEKMIREQLISAIGKIVQPSDFSLFMQYQNKKMFKDVYQPLQFCYSVRNSKSRAPEGTVSIEQQLSASGISDAIFTCVNSSHPIQCHKPMKFALNASTVLSFSGEKYVHVWLDHRFETEKFSPENEEVGNLFLRAEARQFSSFILLLGRISDKSTFDPHFGVVLNNKDELKIPLDLKMIPSAKEFKDSIESLSLEQQEFAKAFREMQLESTMFAVCIIQIKPHLEILLNLLPDSLFKETQLCQELMILFTQYQIPSDLLSFSGEDSSSSDERITAVKENVVNIMGMIGIARNSEIDEKIQQDTYRNRVITISVYMLTNKRFSISIPASSSVVDLKDIIETNQGIPRCQYHLIFEGKQLNDECSLNHYSIADGSTVNLVLRLRGSPGVGKCFGGGGLQGEVSTLETNGNKTAKMRSATVRRSLKYKNPSSAPEILSLPPATLSDECNSAVDRLQQGNLSGDYLTQIVILPDTNGSLREGYAEGVTNQTDEKLEDIALELDFTMIPKFLDESFENSGSSTSVRPLIITPSKIWDRKVQNGFRVEKSIPTTLNIDKQKAEKDKAFYLLDALSRSGGLQLKHTSLHVVVASTHCFDSSLMDMLVKDNINPIQKVVQSTLIMASVVHEVSIPDLVVYSNI